MKSTDKNPATAFSTLLAAIIALSLLATGVSAKAELRIDKAYLCGANGYWVDVTVYLQNEVRGNSLTTIIAQPFDKIGGIPGPNQRKYLVVDYRFNQAAYRLMLK